jgi:hypothetical protein
MTLYGITSSLRDWAATVRKWKEFRQETGTWPLLSILASSLHTMGFVVGVLYLIWYSEKHRWTTNHFTLILVAVSVPYVFVWAWLRDKIYGAEIRRARGQLGDKDSWRSRAALHHQRQTERFATAKSGSGNWTNIHDASWHIDNAIFMIFLTFVATTIFAKILFWLFGW